MTEAEEPRPIEDLTFREAMAELDGIVGVLETGQFLKMCKRIIVGTDEGVKVIEAK